MIKAIQAFVLPGIIISIYYFCILNKRETTNGLPVPNCIQKIIYPFGKTKERCSALSESGGVGSIVAFILYYYKAISNFVLGTELDLQKLWIIIFCIICLFSVVGSIIDLLIEWTHDLRSNTGSRKRILMNLFNSTLFVTALRKASVWSWGWRCCRSHQK